MFVSRLDVSLKGCATAHESLISLCACMSLKLSLSFSALCTGVSSSIIGIDVVVESACVFFFLAS